MAVYVNPMQICLRNKKWPYKEACHLVADSIDELHRFAQGIGLKKAWFQNHEFLPHYDLTRGMRYKAVKQGAIEIDNHRFVEMLQTEREKRGERCRGQKTGSR